MKTCWANSTPLHFCPCPTGFHFLSPGEGTINSEAANNCRMLPSAFKSRQVSFDDKTLLQETSLAFGMASQVAGLHIDPSPQVQQAPKQGHPPLSQVRACRHPLMHQAANEPRGTSQDRYRHIALKAGRYRVAHF